MGRIFLVDLALDPAHRSADGADPIDDQVHRRSGVDLTSGVLQRAGVFGDGSGEAARVAAAISTSCAVTDCAVVSTFVTSVSVSQDAA